MPPSPPGSWALTTTTAARQPPHRSGLRRPNLLYLLETHAGIKARIEPPDDWQDPVPDSGECDEHFALPATPTAAQLNEADAAVAEAEASTKAARARADELRREAEKLQGRKPSGE
jgi:hypothetical protein